MSTEFSRYAQRLFSLLTHAFHFSPHEQIRLLRTFGKWLVLGTLIGALAGSASALFLFSLQWANTTRLAHPWLLYLLPVAGLIIGYSYHKFGSDAGRGTHLVIEEINRSRKRIPLRMAPMVLIGTVLTHLFGGSAGREGTAVQMGSSLADWLQRTLHLHPEDRSYAIIAGISAGFSSVFGTPLAGFVFGLEVQRVGRVRYEAVIPCLVASLAGELVARAWGVTHSHYPHLEAVPLQLVLLGKVALAGIAFGLTALLFIELHHGIKLLLQRFVHWHPLRPVIGGIAIIGMTWIVGSQEYLSLGLPLIQHSLDGTGVPTFAFLGKVIFTAVTLGSGFIGGEVTPLFAMGSTLGYTMGLLLGVDPLFMASLGFVGVFAGASNTPLACLLMGVELFGGGSPVYFLVACFIAYLVSGHRGIYSTQPIEALKVQSHGVEVNDTMEMIAARRHSNAIASQ